MEFLAFGHPFLSGVDEQNVGERVENAPRPVLVDPKHQIVHVGLVEIFLLEKEHKRVVVRVKVDLAHVCCCCCCLTTKTKQNKKKNAHLKKDFIYYLTIKRKENGVFLML